MRDVKHEETKANETNAGRMRFRVQRQLDDSCQEKIADGYSEVAAEEAACSAAS